MFELFGRGERVEKRKGNAATMPHVINVNPEPTSAAAPATAPETTSETSSELSTKKQLRVMFCGTFPIGQSNGYSRVVYYIAKHMAAYSDIQLTIYGFQNYQQTEGSDARKLPPNVILHDALATEEPRRNGFGEKEVATYLKAHPQDIVVIFNDMVVTGALTQCIMQEMTPEERATFKLVSYMDQVYPYQKQMYMDILNNCFDAVIAFTPYWRTVARKLGLKKTIPCYVFPHGFDHELYYPIPRDVARSSYNLPDDAFVVLNLNRNQPRKRWDLTMMAFAQVVKRCHDLHLKGLYTKPLRLMVGTVVQGYWDIMDVYEHELRMLGVPLEFGKECLTAIAKPQQMSDSDINILYNVCDIGLNTCEGEGFGLCQIEHAAVGCPQVAPRIGGLSDFLVSDHAGLVDAKLRYHIDRARDGIGGVAELADANDYADAIWVYYTNPLLLQVHGYKSRQYILQNYSWDVVVNNFYNILQKVRS